jgi:hypothetical protein
MSECGVAMTAALAGIGVALGAFTVQGVVGGLSTKAHAAGEASGRYPGLAQRPRHPHAPQ